MSFEVDVSFSLILSNVPMLFFTMFRSVVIFVFYVLRVDKDVKSLSDVNLDFKIVFLVKNNFNAESLEFLC